MKRRSFLAAAALMFARRVHAQDPIDAMRFSMLRAGAPLPPDFRHYAFDRQPRHTEYVLVQDDGVTVLRARAHASTSGIIRELRVNPRAHPILAWRWKVARALETSDLSTKAGDDFAARLYVTFDVDLDKLPFGDRMQIRLARMVYGPDVPVAALCYVWDSRAPVGTIAPSAYTDRVRLVVVDSGASNAGRWIRRERDVAADYGKAFGAEAPAINGVIVSTDTDNTGEAAEAYYGDIQFRAR